ncbi:MAG: transposase [Deltaproteobacteria bacterium]|nr:transposase [Deltaproteobacteria bacterium]
MKYHPHGSVLFVTLSIEEGLLLLSNPLCLAVLKSCLSRAQHLYPVKICHFLTEATHLHMILVVERPDDVPAFVRHFKTESAHLLNRILGREKRTVWCDGYDSPIVLTPVRALIAITYIYSNPAKDNLEDSVDEYPGFSSWQMFRRGDHKKRWKWIRRPAVTQLSSDRHTPLGYAREAERLLQESKQSHELHVEPNAWMEAFKIFDPKEQQRLNTAIVEHLRAIEERARKKRQLLKQKVLGRERLLRQRLDTQHRPKREGRRTCCISEDRKIRTGFIKFFKFLMSEARRIRRKWALGDFSEAYPPGLYPPSMVKLADPIGVW